MPLGEPLPTIRIKTPEKNNRDWMRINQRAFDPGEHEPLDEEEAAKVNYSSEREEGEVTYAYASNGAFTLYASEKEVASGRGKDDLKETLADLRTSMEEATDITD
jgi:hypothetical protein